VNDENLHELWMAVLLRGIADLLTVDVYCKHKRERAAIQRAAGVWIQSSDNGVGSFNWTCNSLALDPGFVRRIVERARFRDDRQRIFTHERAQETRKRRNLKAALAAVSAEHGALGAGISA
jgi:hypothetical protein